MKITGVAGDQTAKYIAKTFDLTSYNNAEISVELLMHVFANDADWQFQIDCNNDGNFDYNVLRIVEEPYYEIDKWYSGSVDLETVCGYKPSELSFRF